MQFCFFSSLSTGFSKLLVCGGFTKNIGASDSCEVVDLKSPSTVCKNMTNFPVKVRGSFGYLGSKKEQVICGGFQNEIPSNKCYSLENRVWVSSNSMNEARAISPAAQLGNGKVLVTGGFNGSSQLNGAEMLNEVGWENEVTALPFTVAFHCMVAINSTTLMLIGGLQNGLISGKTYYFNSVGHIWTEGPELNHNRIDPSCKRIRTDQRNQKTSIIVAGGGDSSSYISSVEILDEGSNEWRVGPELPLNISLAQFVGSENEGVILIGGYLNSDVILDTLFYLPHASEGAAWMKLEQKLKIGRRRHTSFLVSDSVADCS